MSSTRSAVSLRTKDSTVAFTCCDQDADIAREYTRTQGLTGTALAKEIFGAPTPSNITSINRWLRGGTIERQNESLIRDFVRKIAQRNPIKGEAADKKSESLRANNKKSLVVEHCIPAPKLDAMCKQIRDQQLKHHFCVYIYIYLGFFPSRNGKPSHQHMAECIFYVGKGSQLNNRAEHHVNDDLQRMKGIFRTRDNIQQYAILTPFTHLSEMEAFLIEHRILQYLVEESKFKHLMQQAHHDCRGHFRRQCLINKNCGHLRSILSSNNPYMQRKGSDLFADVVDCAFVQVTCKLREEM
jgi:hypothetical protein